MKLFKKIKEILTPWKRKRRLRDKNLVALYDEGKYLRVGENIDNKEVIINGTKN